MDFLLCEVFQMNLEEKVITACNIPLDVKGLEG